jgi:hypothetical protein
MKRLVADEGVDKAIVEALRADGFDVTYFAEAGAGSLDTEVLAAARQNQCPLVTCDKDFGELVFRQGLTSAGVVTIRRVRRGPVHLGGRRGRMDEARQLRRGASDPYCPGTLGPDEA